MGEWDLCAVGLKTSITESCEVQETIVVKQWMPYAAPPRHMQVNEHPLTFLEAMEVTYPSTASGSLS